jgi:hypothetical protein
MDTRIGLWHIVVWMVLVGAGVASAAGVWCLISGSTQLAVLLLVASVSLDIIAVASAWYLHPHRAWICCGVAPDSRAPMDGYSFMGSMLFLNLAGTLVVETVGVMVCMSLGLTSTVETFVPCAVGIVVMLICLVIFQDRVRRRFSH